MAEARPGHDHLHLELEDRGVFVGDLAERTGGGQANVSKHLQVLLQQGYVDRRKEGTTSWYRITDPQVFTMCELVCGGLEEELNRKKQLLRRRK